MQSPFINQFIGNSVLEAAPYPGSRTASSILAIVTNFYIFTFRGKKKKGLEMPLFPELAENSEGGVSV